MTQLFVIFFILKLIQAYLAFLFVIMDLLLICINLILTFITLNNMQSNIKYSQTFQIPNFGINFLQNLNEPDSLNSDSSILHQKHSLKSNSFRRFLKLTYPLGMNYVNCSTYCNGIWYDGYSLGIQLKVSVDQYQTLTYVDLIYYNYSKLCQNLNTVDIGKTYQYSFDTKCNQYGNIIQSCSVWVILNDQAINGTNHTHTDYVVHRNVGYLNIKQQNNTICFQSQQLPFIYARGTDLDNIVLQIYNGTIPCNVIGCKFCVLNYPNICQVFQQLSSPQVPQKSSCNSKFYLNGSSCKVCLFPCQTCQEYARNCLSCSNFYRLQGNQCVIGDDFTLTTSAVASIPGIELFSIGQIFMRNFGLFWPYYSHNRVYGQQMDDILTFIHTVQNNKWFLLSLEKKIDFKFESLNFSDYSAYSNQQFLKMESRTSYFWDGAFELVFFSFPTMLLVFFVFNKIFYLTFEYRISRHFRPFSFLLMIYFLGIGEDISYLNFLSFNNGINLFSFKFQDKLGHIAWIFVFFLLVFFCSAGYFVAKIVYNKHSKHFIDGFFPKIQSFYILSCLNMKSLVIGSANALLAKNYEALVISLGSIEMVFLIGIMHLQWKNRCYRIQTFMFLQMLKSIIMIILNILLWIDWKIRELQQEQINQQAKKLLDLNCKALVIAIIGLGALEAISTYFSGREMVNYKPKKQVPKAKKGQRQVLKIVSLKQRTQHKKEITEIQPMRVQRNCFYEAKALKKTQKTQRSKQIKIKQPFKRNSNALNIIQQQNYQYDHPQQIIIIMGWN